MENCSSVAVLEFGNEYSGYGFTKNDESQKDAPQTITIQPLKSNRNILSRKRTSTCILFNNKEDVEAVGYEAEEKYAEWDKAGKSSGCFFFMKFQTLLNSQTIQNDKVEDVFGKELNAKTVFSAFIKALKSKLETEMNEQIVNLRTNELRWIITVPADLKRPAEDFMIECAQQAGINVDQLMLIPEAEAALAYCQKFLQSDEYSDYQKSAEYMIVGLGGSDADIRVVKTDSYLLTKKYKETVRVHGSGSEYENFLKQLFPTLDSTASMKILKKSPLVYLDIERGLEEAKRIPQLGDVRKEAYVDKSDNALGRLSQILNKSDTEKVYMRDGKLLFEDVKQYDELFNPTMKSVVVAIRKVFETYEGARKIQFIVLTGDFYKCCLVKHAVGIHFPLKHILFFEREEEAVIKGALFSGQQPYHSTLESLQAYEISKGQKGLLLVINYLFKDDENKGDKDDDDYTKQKERKGSEEDVQKLNAFFKDRNYEVQCWSDSPDLNSEDLKTRLKEVALLENYHCFFCIIMSHGGKDTICTSDGTITVDDLVLPFRNDRKSAFFDKPKIFMVQTCRGRGTQMKQKDTHHYLDHADEQDLPTDADIITIYATTEGYGSFRGMTSTKWKGAWLIQAFLCVAKKYPNRHLLEILTAVNFELAHNDQYVLDNGKCQLSISENALTKLFYLDRQE